jgi:alpha/beta superfamily hydrolase
MDQPTKKTLTGEAPQQHDWLSLIPILAGFYWLTSGDGSWGWLLCSFLPGSLLLASGVSLLLWPGEPKITFYMALGAVLGVLLALPAMLAAFWPALTGLIVSGVAFVIAGRIALKYAPLTDGAPRPPAETKVYAKAALDEALIGYFVAMAKIPSGDKAAIMCDEAHRLEEVLTDEGWLADPASFNRTPTAPEDARLQAARWYQQPFQWLSFSSAFVPHAQLPGSTVWAGHQRNRDCHARVLRHATPGQPWLLCIHGYRMGLDFMDFRLFTPDFLHHKMGLNLVMPLLPLHGRRKLGRLSGDYFLDGDLLDLLYAETQALWDLRRTIAWIRAQEPDARIGVLGYSLGGYNTALLAAYEPGLEFAVAGIPVADFASTLWALVPPPHRNYFTAQGLDLTLYEKLLTVVSPLVCAPKLAPEKLHIFAGSADRVVPPEQPLKLSRHWQRPVAWYPGGHLTFRGEEAVRRTIAGAISDAGWNAAR